MSNSSASPPNTDPSSEASSTNQTPPPKGNPATSTSSAAQNPYSIGSTSAFNDREKTTPKKKADLFNQIYLPLIGILLAFVYGIYNIFAYFAATGAWEDADHAASLLNQLTILSLCQAALQFNQSSQSSSNSIWGGDTDNLVLCDGIFSKLELRRLALQAFPDGIPVPVAGSNSTPGNNTNPAIPQSSSDADAGFENSLKISGGVLGSLGFIMLLVYFFIQWRRYRQGSRAAQSDG